LEKLTFSGAFAILTANVVLLLGGYDKILSLLCVLIVIDYLTGIAKAFKQKNLNSYIGGMGIFKKAGIFLVIIIAQKLDLAMPTDPVFRTVTILFYISNEGISVIENLATLGVPIPKILKDKFKNLKDGEEE